eukprot:COSAG02_NODE_70635_length_194_cov_142.252632_1_plen_35_part_01
MHASFLFTRPVIGSRLTPRQMCLNYRAFGVLVRRT